MLPQEPFSAEHEAYAVLLPLRCGNRHNQLFAASHPGFPSKVPRLHEPQLPSPAASKPIPQR